MKDIQIRRADEHDLNTVAALANEFLLDEADAETRLRVLRQSLNQADYELLVADLDKEIVGVVDGWIVDDFVHGGKLGHIQNLYVSPRYRRRGIGSRLIREIIDRAKAKGVLEIHVSARFDNKSAIALYKKQGFSQGNLQLEMEL